MIFIDISGEWMIILEQYEFEIILSFILGILFIFIQYFKIYQKIRINRSMIAGFSVAYFFFIILTKIQLEIPADSIFEHTFEYLYVLIGFVFNHIIEKIILQKSEKRTQEKAKSLIEKEKSLESVENNLENTLNMELLSEETDLEAFREIARVIKELKIKTEQIKSEITALERKIQLHVSKEINELRFYTYFAYHFLLGILIFNLMLDDIMGAIMIYTFALFMQVISEESAEGNILSDLPIKFIHEENKIKQIIGSIAVLLGIIVGLIIEMIHPLGIQVVYDIYSFIAGVIMYVFFRELIPEKEKGQPILFAAGVVIFTIFTIILRLIQHSFG